MKRIEYAHSGLPTKFYPFTRLDKEDKKTTGVDIDATVNVGDSRGLKDDKDCYSSGDCTGGIGSNVNGLSVASEGSECNVTSNDKNSHHNINTILRSS